ncbi:DoxX family protein [Lolliginicoccus levis]|uniref:DoxX family protein n=1 Tax=Lolliginicoccus levis TaxID=2919542 RepID=UPI00241FFF74|nr:DoxX family protein [Lolliginicoccus levis]
MILRRIARPMIAGVFIANGINTLRQPNEVADKAAPFIDYAHGTLPPDVSSKLPQDPVTLARINAAAQIGAAGLLAWGRAPRLASGVLATSLIPTTVVQHPFWAETDAAARANQRQHFLKNVGLLGGLLIAAADTEGRPSVGWRARKFATRASGTVSAALPVIGSAASSSGSNTKERLAEGWSTVAERTADGLSTLADRTKDVVEEAADTTSRWYGTAAERAPGIYEAAADRGGQLYHRAADRTSEAAHHAAGAAREGTAEVRSRLRHR